jgi:hypothetical protein
MLVSPLLGNAQTVNYKGHSLLTFNLLKYTNWPQRDNIESFIITVVGKSKVQEDLEEMASRRNIDGKKIFIKQINDVKELNYFSHAIFITDGKSGSLGEIVNKTMNQTMLIITEREELVKKGACVSFVIVENGSLRFEVNHEVLSSRNIKIAKELLALALNK